MKLAGAKNQGAWFRFNNWLMHGYNDDGDPQPEPIVSALKEAIQASAFLAPCFTALNSMAADAGFTIAGDEEAWVDVLLQRGIPLQVWMGKLSWTEYDRTGTPYDPLVAGSGYKYTPRGQSELHYFANDLRKICRHFQASVREIADLSNSLANNPGKLPDADPAT